MKRYTIKWCGRLQAAVVPAIHGKWEVRDVPTPHPSTNQVLIKIHASGLCYTDVHITEGLLPSASFPRTIGHEPVGEIVEVGDGVTKRKIGDRVGVLCYQSSCGRCEWCERGKIMFCDQPVATATGINAPGSHAEYMVAYADATTLLPDDLSYEQAAPVFCAGYTVWSGLRFADPKPHERIAVLGIGGLGHLAVQYSKAAGFYTLAITHSKDKEDLASKLGADLIVSNGEALKQAGGGADVILVTSNSYKAASESLKGLRPDGRMVLMGISGEPLIVTSEIIVNRSRIIGSRRRNDQEYLYEALDYVAKGKVKVIAETYSLHDIARAYENVAAGNVRFRAVIKI
ncbi:MAG: alcohol dehydrogenase catalytic domain-containing protein [Candidatus Nitrosopolaris sp.]